MAKKRDGNKKRTDTTQHISWYYLIPIAFILSIVPLIVFLKQVPVPPEISGYWTSSTENIDFFSYAKTRWLLPLTGFSFLSLGALLLQKKVTYKHSNLFIPLGIYAFFVILSTLFAEYTTVALQGFPDRYEGMYVVLAYLLLTLMVVQFIKNETHITVLIGSLFCSATVAGTIGILQFFGHDFFRMAIGKKLILPSELYHIADTLNFTFGPHTIYSTMYNTNYVGSYMALVLPLAITAFLYFKDYRYRILSSLFIALMFANWLGSNSRAGLLGGGISLLLLFILLRKQILLNWKPLLAIFASFAIIFMIMDTASDGYLSRGYTSIIPQPDVENSTTIEESAFIPTISPPILKDIIVEDHQTTIVTDQHSLTATMEDGFLYIQDENAENIALLPSKDNQYTLEGEQYAAYTITMHGNISNFQFNHYNFYLGVIGNRLVFLDSHGQEAMIAPVSSWGFKGKELWGSSRGYIWSRSLPLLKDTLIMGHGQDTYPLYFPQHDYIGKMNYLSEPYIIVDKPHNLYLQIGIQSGIVSLLAFIAMFTMYAVNSLRLYMRNTDNTLMQLAGASIFTSIMGYLVTAFFNDSIVSVAPVFWILFGIGIACNYYVNQHSKKQDSILMDT